MGAPPAVKVGIDLLHLPSRVRVYRAEPLPHDVLTVLRIAAGDEAAEAQAAAALERPHELVRAGAAFFIEQILLAPESDSYRVLGADRNASAGELRRNMALLLKGLHPDTARNGDRSVFAGRVTSAWENLKTPERRAAYDKAKQAVDPKMRSAHGGKRRRRRRHPLDGKFGTMQTAPLGLLQRALSLLLRGDRPMRRPALNLEIGPQPQCPRPTPKTGRSDST